MCKRLFFTATILSVVVLGLAGCKRNVQGDSSAEIQLPPGLVHIQAQWVDGALWVESFDPKTNACLLRQYANGKPVENGGRILMKGCKVQLGPMMPSGEPMAAAAPAQPPRHGAPAPGAPKPAAKPKMQKPAEE